jgi:energy-coupling factor transporter ATP-binding protein EcfA2
LATLNFGNWLLHLDEPPHPELFAAILRGAGEKAKEGNRVEVPFEFIAPDSSAFWEGDSRSEVVVPLGRAGATKRQCMELGKGTKQHVLIAGKTGSGKSTLLHALITNLALIYRPDEVELYLVDFKKGVEFKTYATNALPHARVVAIESEREFGLSVLQRLDKELKDRGDKFRNQGVQDIAAFRAAKPGERCPRILLIVDEFQEFFVENDLIQQNATMFLEHLVRQGRAFGIHVILGSQTLLGTQRLTGAIVSQMAIRIALQCSIADSTVIFSEHNTAARLLSRPGDAIYNDASGLEEGNDRFQVVWLPDDRRVGYLQNIQELARQRRFTPPSPQIVFEGYSLADIDKNHLLNQFLDSTKSHPEPFGWKAWLGEPISIKDPTYAEFRPQASNNLLIVGQQEEIGIGVTFASMLSIIAQNQAVQRPTTAEGVRFYVFDGTPVDSPYHEVLAGWVKRLPQNVRLVARKNEVSTINDILSEIGRRSQADEPSSASAWFLVIHGLQYFRDLRRPDEPPLLRRSGEKELSNPAKDLQSILREGPAVRIHTILWCDSLTNLNRTLDRQGLREFEMRVVLQMGKGDSINLMVEPLAAELGSYRAYFFAEQRVTAEKFRPYGIPGTEWIKRLERLQEKLRSKS